MLAGVAALALASVVGSSAGSAWATVTSAPPVAATKAPVVTFGVEPASSRAPDGRPFFSFGVTPGGLLVDHVAILNYSLRPLPLSVYPQDAVNTASGGFTLKVGAIAPTDAGAWISLGRPRLSVTVPARRSVHSPPAALILPITLRVPFTATPGDHVAGIVAVLTSVARRGRANVRLDQRVATRVFIRVSGTVHAQLSVENVSASYQGTLNPVGRGQVTVTYRVRNSGNAILGGTQAVQVTGWFGQQVTVTTLPQVPLLLPGNSVEETVQVPGVFPSGPLTATVAVIPLHLQGEVDPGLVGKVTASTTLWAVPWPLFVVLLVLAGLGAEYLRRRRRQSPAGPPPPDEMPTKVSAKASA
jgi:hypothetical protein